MVQNLHINKDEFTEEQINQLIEDNNITIKLTNKRKKLLAVLLHLNGLDDKDEQGRFFIDNLWLSQFVGMTESNMLIALRYFQSNGIIQREKGTNHKCSRYKIINSTNQKTIVQNNSIIEENNSIIEENNSIIEENNSRDRDIELDREKEKDIYNIIINKINNIIKEKENNIINIIKEKDTLMEEMLQEQINQLQQQNEILTARLNNAAKQFKSMISTMRELQQKNNSLEEQINQLKKENKPSTAFCGDAVEDVKEVKKEQTPTVGERKDKEQIRTIDVEVKPSTAFCGDAVDAKQEQSPTEEGINVEGIVGYFKEKFKDPQEAREMENALLGKCKEARLSYYKRRELELKLNKYIKLLELSMDKEEVKEPIKEEVKETIPTVQVEVAQVPIQEELKELPQEAIKEADEVIVSRREEEATEGKESTFVDNFQDVKSNCPIGEERLRYQDLKTKLYYQSLEEAQAANVNPMNLYDYEVSRCVFSYQ